MHFWCLITLISALLATIRSHEYKFGTDINRLKMCIEYHLLNDPYLKIGNDAENLSKIVSKRFGGKSFTEQKFKKAFQNIFCYVRRVQYFQLSDNNVLEKLKAAIKKSLKSCVDRNNFPKFVDEPQVLTDLLDFVLVDWTTPLNEMILTQQGRSILRIYAYSAGVKLISALKYFSMDFDMFHHQLQIIWLRRAQQFYDGRGDGTPYIRHRFTTLIDRMSSLIQLSDIHTIDDVISFGSRRSEDLSYRNPAITVWNRNQVFDIPEDTFSNGDNVTIESLSYRTTAAEYYLELHIVRCYRIILFVLEMQMRGINTDEDDIYDGIIPANFMPFPIQEIACSGIAYRNYLTLWRRHLQQFTSEELEQCYSREDLIMLLALLIRQRSKEITPSSSTTSTTSSTTIFTTSTESSDHENGSKKGGVRSQDCGKYFSPNKRFRSMFCEQNKQQSGQMDTNSKSYGYVADNEELNQLMLIQNDHSIFQKFFVESAFFMRTLY